MKETILLLLLVMLCPVILSSQCLSGDCKSGSGIFIFSNGSKYAGDFQGGEMNGTGTFFYTNGTRYQGEWQQGRPHGRGVKIMADGSREVGLWVNGRLERVLPDETASLESRGGGLEDDQNGCVSGNCTDGRGVYIYPTGAVYVGEFRNGEIHGVGVCYYLDGSQYRGDWAHRYPEGFGTKRYPDGRERTGRWTKGQPVDDSGKISGEGVIHGSDGSAIQSGCLKGNCSFGNGIYAYPDGSRYEGFFENGKPQGSGTFYYPNGDRFTGDFQDGFPDGQGRLYHADGTITNGRWSEGEYLGTYAGAGSKGCIEGNCQAGQGVYIFQDGAKYIGAFENRLPQGRGTVYYTNGERYDGQMAKGAFDGYGTLYLKDGTRVSGYWEAGTYLGADRDAGRESNQPPPTNDSYTGRPAKAPELKVWAVIVGVSMYDHMPVLKYPDDDAYRIYAFLKSPEGGALADDQISILVDEEATRANIRSTMQNLFWKAGPNDLVLLYFSGHGLKGSFLPIDYDGVDNKLYHEEINAIFAKSKAKYKLCIADACHSGSLFAMKSGKAPNLLMKYYETLAQARAGTALIMSSKSDETSLESSGLRQGVFSHFLIRGLKGEADASEDGVVSVQELFDFVQTNVRAYTGNRQSPVMQGDYDPKMTVAVKR